MNAKFSVYYFQTNLNINGDFQVCISVPLSSFLLMYYAYLACIYMYLKREKMRVLVLQNYYMFAKNCHLHYITGRANILSKYIIYIFFKFGRGFCGSFTMLVAKALVSCCKKILNQFLLHCTSTFLSSESVSQIFKILFQTRRVNIFVLPGVFVSRFVQLKSSFSDEKNISGEI